MNARSYKIIFGLLSFCALSVLAVQAYWIRNVWIQKKENFNSSVYSALEDITLRLQEQENLNMLKEYTFIVNNGDTLAKTPSKHIKVATLQPAHIVNLDHNVNVTSVKPEKWKDKGGAQDSIFIIKKNNNRTLIIKEKRSEVILSHKDVNAVMEKSLRMSRRSMNPKASLDSAKKIAEKSKEVSRLVDKMMMEIKVMDSETGMSDSAIYRVIKKVLANKGIFTPFEFAVKNFEKKKERIINKSEGFDSLETAYRADLSANRIFSTRNFLFLQFPAKRNLILAGMKGSLILSLVFSLTLLLVFYYTLHLMFKQKRLTEIKNDFVNNMTHELKTPIATISLAVDAMNNPQVRNDEERFKDYSRILKEENSKLNHHVERVLQLSLLERGELKLHKTQVNLCGLARSVIGSFKLRTIEQKADIEFTCSEPEVLVQGDEHHLRAVFSNLLDNALKYSGENCRIELTVLKRGDQALVLCRDNGIGISSDQYEKIFEKFYRVQGGDLHDVKGFGLGLSYSKSIVEAHNGSIELHSEVGKGTEFIIKLPVAKL